MVMVRRGSAKLSRVSVIDGFYLPLYAMDSEAEE